MNEKISLLVPFRDNSPNQSRLKVWSWLLQFWKNELPDAEIVMGDDDGKPFSKTCAVNDAFKKSTGDIIVILDADCYINPAVIIYCANEIRKARLKNEALWFLPYRNLYRLTDEATQKLLDSNPTNAFQLTNTPDKNDIENSNNHSYGHWFGALIQIMPREAFQFVGGMDPSFRGWGGEDVSFVRVLNTLYGTNRTTKNAVYTLSHHQIGEKLTKQWEGQEKPYINSNRSIKYKKAYQNKNKMELLIKEWQGYKKYQKYLIPRIDLNLVDKFEEDMLSLGDPIIDNEKLYGVEPHYSEMHYYSEVHYCDLKIYKE